MCCHGQQATPGKLFLGTCGKTLPFVVMFSHMTVRNELWDVAVDQYGYVTTANARDMGIATVELGKLANRGKLMNVSHGVYRFPEWPVSDRDHLMEAVLWTKDPLAVLSHDTALDVLDLCEINPTKLHLTVPKRRWGFHRTTIPSTYVIHCENLTDQQRGWWEQIPCVTAPTAIRQGIATLIRPDLLRQAIQVAEARGLIGQSEVAELTEKMKEVF